MPGPIASFWIGYAIGLGCGLAAACAGVILMGRWLTHHGPPDRVSGPLTVSIDNGRPIPMCETCGWHHDPGQCPPADVTTPTDGPDLHALIDCRDRSCGRLAGEPVCSTCPAAVLHDEWNTRYPVPDVTTPVPQQKAEAPRFLDEIGTVTDDQWDQLNTRGPVTDYPPGVPHHDLEPHDVNGVTVYRAPGTENPLTRSTALVCPRCGNDRTPNQEGLMSFTCSRCATLAPPVPAEEAGRG
jgi:hypothetical protein